jgi:hypothetical protein
MNPSNLALAFPYGGTELGLIQDAELVPNAVNLPIEDEAWGVEVVDVLNMGCNWQFKVTVRGADPDAFNAIFPGVSTGPVSGRPDIAYPSSFHAGTLLSANGVKLLVVPNDTGTFPLGYLPVALPMLAEDASENWQADQEWVVKAQFQAIRDGTGRVYLQRRLEDLTL